MFLSTQRHFIKMVTALLPMPPLKEDGLPRLCWQAGATLCTRPGQNIILRMARGWVDVRGSQDSLVSLNYEKIEAKTKERSWSSEKNEMKCGIPERETVRDKGTECKEGSVDSARSMGRGIAFFPNDFCVHILICVSFYQLLFAWNDLRSNYFLQLRKALTKTTVKNEKLSLKILIYRAINHRHCLTQP